MASNNWRNALLAGGGIAMGVAAALILFASTSHRQSHSTAQVETESKAVHPGLEDAAVGSLAKSTQPAQSHQNQPTRNDFKTSVSTVAESQPAADQKSQPIKVEYAEPVAESGEHVKASVTVGGQEYQLSSNQIGCFQRVYVEPRAKIPVQLTYPDGNPGDTVVVESEDGGRIIESNKIVYVGNLGDDRNLAFQFETTTQQGTYRVVLRKGADVKQLEFWVGQPIAVGSIN
jgi:hypothetical protein